MNLAEMKQQFDAIRQDVLAALETVQTLKEVEQIRVQQLGKKGPITEVLKNIKNIAYLDKSNTFTEPINAVQYKLNNNSVISDDSVSINLGNNEKKINLQSSDGKLYINNIEFKTQGNIESKFYTFDELKKYDNNITNYVKDCIMFTQGKIGVISGYFEDGDTILGLNSGITLFKIPVKIKFYNTSLDYSQMWFNNNMLIETQSNWDYSVIRMGGYFNNDDNHKPFHFQGVFYLA